MSVSDIVNTAGTTIPASIFVSGVSWGFTTSLYSVCTHNLTCSLHSTKARKKTILLITWISLLWTLSSLSTVIYAYSNIYAYSWELDYPGGPVAYLTGIWNQPLPVLAYAINICTMWFADAILLWRVVVFCHGFHRLTRRLILSLVFLLYIGMVGAGCLMLAVYTSGIGLFSTLAKQAAIPCLALSMTLDLFVTSFISIRLLSFRRLLVKTLGREHARSSPYTSVAAILVESSALYAMWSLAFIVVYALGDPGQSILLISLCNIQVIAPMLIVYRASKGRSWEPPSTTRSTLTHMSFSEPEEP